MSAIDETYRRLSSGPEAHVTIEALEPEAFADRVAAAGWIRGADLAADDDAAFGALRLAAVAVTGEVDAKTIGLGMAWAAAPLVAVPLGAYATERRVPDLTPADVAFRPYGSEPGASTPSVVVRSSSFHCLPTDPGGSDPSAVTVPDAALGRRFVEVIEDLISPIALALRRRTTVAEAAVWGLAAGSITYELAEEGITRSGLPIALEEADAVVAGGSRLGRRRPALSVLDTPGGPWFDFKSAVCCRADRWVGREGERCLTCPLRDDESRLEGLRAWRASLVTPGG